MGFRSSTGIVNNLSFNKIVTIKESHSLGTQEAIVENVYYFTLTIDVGTPIESILTCTLKDIQIGQTLRGYFDTYNIRENTFDAVRLPIKLTFKDEVLFLIDANGNKTEKFFNELNKQILDISGEIVTHNGVQKFPEIPANNEAYMGHTQFLKGVCVDILDGDTITLNTGAEEIQIRFLGINTAEIDSANQAERAKAEKEKEFTSGLILGKKILVGVCSHDPESYGRVVGTVYIIDQDNTDYDATKLAINLTKTMLLNGIGKFYPYAGIGSDNVACPKVMDLYLYAKTGLMGLSSDVIAEINKAEVDLESDKLFGDDLQDFNRILAEDDRPAFDADNRVRIGDCELVIPPSAITIVNQKTTKNIPSIRSKGSSKSQTGHGDVMIQLSVYFSGEEVINGTPITSDNLLGYKVPKGETYYVNGLRPLIAQFMRTPFLPIENNFLNVTNDIQAVTLLSISTKTVTGYPGVLLAEIKLMKFNWDAYLFDTILFGDRFNWPLFRYYYQKDLLSVPAPAIPGLKPITAPGPTSLSKLMLSSPDDLELNEANEAYKELMKMDKPDIAVAEKALESTAVGMIAHDFYLGSRAVALYDSIDADMQEIDKDPECYLVGTNLFITAKHSKTILKIKEIIGISDDILAGVNTHTSSYIDEDNKAKLTKEQFYLLWSWLFQVGTKNKQKYNEAISKKVAELQKEWDKLESKSISNQSAIQMYEATGLDNLIITSINVSYENIITGQQMNSLETPTHQFLGSQDIFARISMQTTDQDAVAALRELIEKVSSYARTYRQNVVTSILDVNNEIINMFGMKSCLVDQFTVSTVENNPEAFNIDLVLVDFNKTQRAREEFKSFSAIDDNINMKNHEWNLEDTRDIGPDYNWIKVEEKIRTMELYPDLCLPTYAQLREAMNKLNIKGSLRTESETIYVDPDFYIGIERTFTTILKEILKEDTSMTLIDLAYVGPNGETLTGETIPGKAMGLSQETLDATEGIIDQNNNTPFESTNPQYQKVMGYAKSLPTEEECEKWHKDSIISKSITTDKSKVYINNPSKWEINKVIVDTADTYGFTTEHKNMGICLVKALAEYYSSWKNIVFINDEKRPIVDASGRAGLVGLETTNRGSLLPSKREANSIKKEANTVIEDEEDIIRRLCYDWGYNILTATTELKDIYDEIIVGNSSNLEIVIIAKYLDRSKVINTTTVEEIKKDKTVAEILAMYDRYKSNPEASLMGQNSYESSSAGILRGVPNIGNLSSTTTVEKQNTPTTTQTKNNDPINYTPDPSLQKYFDDEARNLGYFDPGDSKAMNAKADTIDFDAKKTSTETSSETPTDTNPTYYPDGDRLPSGASSDAARIGMIAYDDARIEKNNPEESHKGSCQDMLEYDARGRLSRAFPTYQLFFIDEGRWLSFHRLWDNLYGYNAVQSIDVHKSRLQPADTCAIVLNNTYETITEYDSSTKYYNEGITLENFIFGITRVEESLMESRINLMNQLMIKTGCRIHLRMGYTADPKYLPVVFNGTITELDVQEETTIIAQGDGIELTNTLQAAYGDTSGGIAGFGRGEPRNLILWLLDDRSWFEKWIKEDMFGFKTAPRGVAHFGNPRYKILNETLSETGQNIYSVILDQNDPYRENIQGTADWLGFINPDGDEPNISIYVYDKTAWDLIQICTMAANDYVCAVYPFNGRSTLFFGKPYYKMSYKYERQFTFNSDGTVAYGSGYKQKRKVFQQYRLYHSSMDIISNKIKASEDGVYTNVIGMYSSGQQDNPKNSVLVCADTDIYAQKQKTTMINTEIEGSSLNPNGTSKIANNITTSALADSIRLMYKGQLIVLGDPSAKPYDLMYIHDLYTQMKGPAEIREVVHSLSRENGFISMIVPDCCVATVDKYRISRSQWLTTIGSIAGAQIILRTADVLATRTIINKIASPLIWKSIETSQKALGQVFDNSKVVSKFAEVTKTNYKAFTDSVLKTFKGSFIEDEKVIATKLNAFFTKKEILVNLSDDFISKKSSSIAKSIKNILGQTASKGGVAKGVMGMFTVGAFAEMVAMYVIVESVSELITRKLRNRQAVIISLLSVNGKAFEAGITGHKGAVVGDTTGKMDKFLEKYVGWAVDYTHKPDVNEQVILNEVNEE